MKIKKKSEVSTKIPTASLPDIIFMLLFFFMVSTVLRQYTGLMVDLPAAEKIEKIESRRHTGYLWITREGAMMFDDVPIKEERELYLAAYNRRLSDPQLLMSLKFDRRAKMEYIYDAMDQLRQAGALKVNYATKLKAR